MMKDGNHGNQEASMPAVPMTRRLALPTLAAAVACPVMFSGAARAADAPTELKVADRDAMRALAQSFMTAYGVPGMSVAVAFKGRLVYAEAYGYADVERREVLTPNHLMRLASISKPITSAAVYTLIEKGTVRLSDKVIGPGSILGTDFGKPPYRPYVTDVTVEHLLTHTSGGWGNKVADPMFANPSMPQAQLVAWAVANASLVQPGARYDYSNFGFCLLGRVIEKVSGKPYADYVQEAVLRPSGVAGMRIAGNTLAERLPEEVVYYASNDGSPYGMNVRRMDAHGGWASTAADLVRFATRALGDGQPSLLTKAGVQSMTLGSGANPQYAKGWGSRDGVMWHNGSLPGTATVMVRTPNGLCWAALCNTRRQGTNMEQALDALPWNMTAQVGRWPSGDLWQG